MEDLWVDFRYRWVSPLMYDVCMIHVMFQVSPVSMFRNNSPFGCDTSSYADSLQSKYVFWQFFYLGNNQLADCFIHLFYSKVQRFIFGFLFFCDSGYSTMDEAPSRLSNMSRPSAKSIYCK